MADLPGSVLFACTTNAVRSPMAEGIMKSLFGQLVYIDSAGVRREEIDPDRIETAPQGRKRSRPSAGPEDHDPTSGFARLGHD